MRNKTININISTFTLVKALLFLLLLYLLFLIKDILIIFFVSLILSSALDPWVDWFQKRKIPRGVSMLFIYLVFISLIGTVIYLIIPPMLQEISQLRNDFPRYFGRVLSGISVLKDFSAQYGLLNNIQTWLNSLASSFQGTASSFFTTVAGVFGGVISFLLVMVMTFYMTVEENAVRKIVWQIVPDEYQPYVLGMIGKMQQKIGLWFRGQLILSLIIFIFVYTALTILGVEYALVLALIAGILESVPYLGPILSALPAIFFAFVQSPWLAFSVAVIYYVIQWLENNILVPKIMQKAVGLNPIIIISVLLIGFKVAGILGAILAIPVATAASIVVIDLFNNRETHSGESNS